LTKIKISSIIYLTKESPGRAQNRGGVQNGKDNDGETYE